MAVAVALEVINRKFTENINQTGMEDLLEHTYFIPKDKVISILELEFNSCVFSFQEKFYWQFQEPAMGFAYIWSHCQCLYGNFEEMVLDPQCPIPTPWWKRYLDDVISIVKNEQVDILFNHIHSVDPHIKFTMEAPGNDGNILFLDTKCSSNSDCTVHASAYKEPTQTNCYLDLNSNYPMSVKKQSSIP